MMVTADLYARGADVSNTSVPQSYLAGAGALVLAFAAHAVFALFNQEVPVDQAGGNTELAAIGNSFANLAVGVETPQKASETTEVQDLKVEPQQVEKPVEPEQMARRIAQAHTALRSSSQIKAVQGGVPLVPVEAQQRAEPVEARTQQVQDVVMTQMPAPAEATPVEKLLQPTETEAPPPPSLEQSAPPKEQVPIPQSTPVLASLRPAERPVQPEPIAPAAPKTSAEPRPEPVAKPRGNSDANATRGVASSTRSQSGGQAQATAGRAQVQGNAAASNYAGLVMRQIQRAKRRADVRGVAMVRFSVGASGSLISLRLARSSGSGRLDEIAMAQVRRAAPFPPPPAGARRTFTVRIKGK